MEENGQKEREQIHNDIERIKHALKSDWSVEFVESEPENVATTDDPVRHIGSAESCTYHTLQTPPILGPQRAERHDNLGNESENAHNDEISPFTQLPSAEDCGRYNDSALALNWTYQHLLKETVLKLQLMLSSNRERQSVIKQNIEKQSEQRINQPKVTPMSEYGIPYIKDEYGMCPPANADVQAKKAMLEQQNQMVPTHMWPQKETNKLKTAIKKDCLEKAIRPLMNRKEIEYGKLKRADNADSVHIRQIIESLDNEISKKKLLSDDELFGSREDSVKIDWLKISNQVFNGVRSEIECERIWRNAFHPSINTKSWSKDEDKNLLHIISGCDGELGWDVIADKLQTSRTAFQCLQRYHIKLHPSLKTGKWNDEEDQLFMTVIESCRSSMGEIDWDQVANYMEGRSLEQCKVRWEFFHRGKKRRWTEDEDESLLNAMVRFGKKWSRIERYVPNRSQVQCRDRYMNSLDKSKIHGGWSKEEDLLLVRLVREHGKRWTKIASLLHGRTDHMVMCRFKRLLRWGVQNQLCKRKKFAKNRPRGGRPPKSQEEIKNDISELESKRRKLCEKKRLVLCDEPIAGVRKIDRQIKDLKDKCKNSDKEDNLVKLNEELLYAAEEKDIKSLATKSMLRKKKSNRPKLSMGYECDEGKLQDERSTFLQIQQQLREQMIKDVRDREDSEEIMCQIDKILAGRLETFLEKEIYCKIQTLQSDSSPRQIIQLCNYILSALNLKEIIPESVRGRPAGRSKPSQVDKDRLEKVEEELDELIGEKDGRQMIRGKVKTYFKPEGRIQTTALPLSKQTLQKLSGNTNVKTALNIFMCALQIDYKKCLSSLPQVNKTVLAQQSSNEDHADQINSTALKAESLDDLPPDNADSDDNLNELYSKILNDLAVASGIDVNNIRDTDHEETQTPLPAASGQAAKCYILPPLPPSLCSLRAFKRLLMQRKKLLAMKKKATAHPKIASPTKCCDIGGNDDLIESNNDTSSSDNHGSSQSNTDRIKPHKLRELVSKTQKTHEYQLLNARFASLFLWPAFMSTVYTHLTPDSPLIPPKLVAVPRHLKNITQSYPSTRKQKNKRKNVSHVEDAVETAPQKNKIATEPSSQVKVVKKRYRKRVPHVGPVRESRRLSGQPAKP